MKNSSDLEHHWLGKLLELYVKSSLLCCNDTIYQFQPLYTFLSKKKHSKRIKPTDENPLQNRRDTSQKNKINLKKIWLNNVPGKWVKTVVVVEGEEPMLMVFFLIRSYRNLIYKKKSYRNL